MRSIETATETILPRRGQSMLSVFQQIPGLILLVVLFNVATFFGGSVFGYNVSGLGWVIPLAAALLISMKSISKVSFPYLIWLPWVLFLLVHLLFIDYAGLDPRVIPLQRTLQLITPVFIGMAVSTYRPTSVVTASFVSICRYLAFVLLGITVIKTGILLTGRLPDATGMAAEVMTIMLLCVLFINRYLLLQEKRDLQLWALLAFVPFIAITRTAIIVTLLTFPFALGPMKPTRRFAALALIVLLGIAAFYSPRIQSKTFYSKQGEMSDVMGPDFNTSGRSTMWRTMFSNIDEAVFDGHGTGAGETFAWRATRQSGYPHNDWLLTLYDYGILGASLFGLCLILSLLHATTSAKYCTSQINKILFLTGASAILPFSMMMFTDNIMVYSSFFGNLQFTMLGLAYGALQKQFDDQAQEMS